jgi:hypothetical protein
LEDPEGNQILVDQHRWSSLLCNLTLPAFKL